MLCKTLADYHNLRKSASTFKYCFNIQPVSESTKSSNFRSPLKLTETKTCRFISAKFCQRISRCVSISPEN